MALKKNKEKIIAILLPLWAWPAYFLALWQVLLMAQNPGLMSDDSGEMVAAAYRLGLPHPPGYPLFNLLGHFFTLLPIGTVAFRLNLFSALLTLASLGFVLDTCRRGAGPFWNRSKQSWVILTVMGIIFISYRSLFAQSLTAKGCLYTLTLLFLSIVVWLRINTNFSKKSCTTWFLAVFLWSLGMANHWQTQVLCLPFLMLWFFKENKVRNVKTLVYSFAVALIGLSLYLYLPFRTTLGVQPCWGNPVTLKGFYWVVSRQLVVGSEHWVQPGSFYFHSLQWVFRAITIYWLPGFSLLVLGGAVVFWRKNPKNFYSILSLFVPVFAAVGLVHEERNHYLVPIYLVSLSGLMIVFGFEGTVWLVEKLGRNKKFFGVILFLLAASSLGWLGLVFQKEDKSWYTLAEDFGVNIMKGLPKNALLLADGDHYVMPIWYQQYVEDLRPDLIFEPSFFLYHDWGWSQLAKLSEDLRDPIYSTPLFTGRLKALTDQSVRHPFYYSIGREYLETVLDQVPGQWVPSGLAFEWTLRSPRFQSVSKKEEVTFKSERFRGLEEFPDFSGMDPSTRQIYRYYSLQHYLTAQFIDKLSPKKLKTPK
jgi:hypothetical protein